MGVFSTLEHPRLLFEDGQGAQAGVREGTCDFHRPAGQDMRGNGADEAVAQRRA